MVSRFTCPSERRLEDETVFDDGGGETMTVVWCALASADLAFKYINPGRTVAELRTPHVKQNPLTHDPSGRICEIYATRHTW